MRRWNGWGDDSVQHQLPGNGLAFLEDRIGTASRLPEARLADVAGEVPPSRLPDHPLISKDPETRIRHARGQSLPDWLALRSGHIFNYPDGVAQPGDTQQVRELLQLALDQGFQIIPYGGGTSVAGHINPLPGDTPVLTLSLARMTRLLDLDTESQVATFGAGTPGPLVESQLRAHGYTLGHFPQSFELSTLGGWIASRSSGQQSLRYGRIEQLFAGGTVETLRGTLEIPALPASSAGPDIREMVLGSEGRLGVITEAKVRVSPLPERESFHVMFFPGWKPAREAARLMVQARLPVSMLRLSNPQETQTQLALAGHPLKIRLLERYLALRGAGPGKCMMTFGITGSQRQSRFALEEVRRFCKPFHGSYMGTGMGRKWAEKRFAMPYLRESLWQQGYAVDTLETATNWSNVDTLMALIEDNLRQGLVEDHQSVHVFSHLSHVYPQGSSIYTTYVFPVADNYRNTRARWQHLKETTSALIVNNRGTISHQHGVGKDHAPWLAVEKGAVGMMALQGLINTFDPDGYLNPGTLISRPSGDPSP